MRDPIWTDNNKPKVPRKMRSGSGAPSFCWICMKQLQRAPGKGMFYFNVVREPEIRGSHDHRVHGDKCTRQSIADGCKLVAE